MMILVGSKLSWVGVMVEEKWIVKGSESDSNLENVEVCLCLFIFLWKNDFC